MPVDKYEEADEKEEKAGGPHSQFKEFDCPSCSANNPCDPPFANGDELICNYCGAQYKVVVTDEGRAKFKEM
jgi:hypothetical protein